MTDSRSIGKKVLQNIAVVIPLPYEREGGFWTRDAGLLVRGFRELGCRATLVALPGKSHFTQTEGFEADGLRLGSMAELCSPQWWQEFAPDAVVVFGWGLHHFEKIRAAIRTVTPHIAERMDTDGMRSPLLNPLRFAYLSWAQAMARMHAGSRYSWKTLPAAVQAAAWTGCCMAVAPSRGASAARIASCIPVLLVESDLACKRIKRWLEIFGCDSGGVHFCPNSVDTQNLPFPDPAQKKPNRVVAVGRWLSFQKNFEAVLSVAKDFLRYRNDYQFHIIGEIPKNVTTTDRLILHGKKSQAELGSILRQSQILFAASRYESFHLAAAEALCCGCSVVLPTSIPTAVWFAGMNSGAVASECSHIALEQSLRQEVRKWDMGARNPAAIAAHWRPILGPRTQAQTILELWEEPVSRSPA